MTKPADNSANEYWDFKIEDETLSLIVVDDSKREKPFMTIERDGKKVMDVREVGQ